MAASTDPYRAQHRELRAVLVALAGVLDHDHLSRGGHKARALLGQLGGKLKVHLEEEGRHLYPELLRCRDPEVRRVAGRFQAVNAELRGQAELFLAAWLKPDAIGADPNGFAAAARWLSHALSDLIAGEDAELFPLAEAAEREGRC